MAEKNKSQRAFEAQLNRKFRGTERQDPICIPQTFVMTQKAWEKAHRLGELAHKITKEELGEGSEVGGLLLGSKDVDDFTIHDVCLTRQVAGKNFIRSADDFAAGVKVHKESYRIMGAWHTHPYFSCEHSDTDDTNLNLIVFPQIAAHNFLYAHDDIRLLSLPVKIQAENSEQGVLLNISETPGKREIKIWLPGCRLDAAGLEDRLPEFDLLYDRLREFGFALSLVLDLKGNYHAKIVYAPRKPTFEIDTSAVENNIIQFEQAHVKNDISFTEDDLIRIIRENVSGLQRAAQTEIKAVRDAKAKAIVAYDGTPKSGKMGDDGRYHLDIKDI
ncbi:MAG: Mov34/MPN/PAD-1 family protein [DPANN group archaeon]|nr:Mov34/MPN/PAD-1 family protein [DPANN group archaeon]